MSATVAIFAAAAAAAARTMTFDADHVAVDAVTKAAVATGRVHAAYAPFSLRSGRLERRADGTMLFSDPTVVTTCTNAPGHTHWSISGSLEYKERDSVKVEDAVLRLWEIPVFWLPWAWYPLDTDCGFSWMPGYTGRWGAYLLTKYRYHLLGDKTKEEGTWWLDGATRFDLRYRNGLAFGEDLDWELGPFGRGNFGAYWAWDEDSSRYGSGGNYAGNWGSSVDRDRYLLTLTHKWEPTERDVVRVQGSFYSDSYVIQDFQRDSFFSLKDRWLSYSNSGVFWEHLEDALALGAEVSGRLNKFYAMTGRLPEIYLDVNPTPVWTTPLDYESSSRIGWLKRDFAEFGAGTLSDFGTNPGPWADYEALRIDTYHRVSAPFRTLGDTIAVVPRIGYRGTYWSESGRTDLTGRSRAADAGQAFRSIGEAGVTFAARGTSAIGDIWRHCVEPYLDATGQEAWLSGLGSDGRPYMFDAVDGSMTWEDQFAGRARGLPYSYYGVTPGLRNTWSRADERGRFRRVVDLDAYVAAQFNTASYTDGLDERRLAVPGRPNYGVHGAQFVPGARLRWTPEEDTDLGVRAEYDSDNNRVAYASLLWTQRFTKDFAAFASYGLRNHRYWDFSSAPRLENNFAKMHILDVGFEQTLLDWLAWGPRLRWDLQSDELDSIGGWVDLLTDCLGFRFVLEYVNSYTTIDGFRRDDDWTVGFYVYLRCFGPESGNVFGH